MNHTASTRLEASSLTFVATLGGFLFGYDTAVISGAVSAIDVNFITPRGLSETARNSLSGWTVSCALFGCVFGALLAGWAANAIGRRTGMMLAAVLFLVSSLGAAWPESGFGAPGSTGAAALGPFVAYRILGGVGIGLASMLSPLYIAENAPPAPARPPGASSNAAVGCSASARPACSSARRLGI
jgi:SP family xylose:H+ symportor-like MFS transporter